MTIKEAIAILKRLQEPEAWEPQITHDAYEALQMVIDILGEEKYEYHYDHTDCIWYRPEARNRCPATCAQYRDGWNDAMQYIFLDGKGYRPYRRDVKYEDDQTGSDQVAKRSRNP